MEGRVGSYFLFMALSLLFRVCIALSGWSRWKVGHVWFYGSVSSMCILTFSFLFPPCQEETVVASSRWVSLLSYKNVFVGLLYATLLRYYFFIVP